MPGGKKGLQVSETTHNSGRRMQTPKGNVKNGDKVEVMKAEVTKDERELLGIKHRSDNN